jgi:hypothetical protein
VVPVGGPDKKFVELVDWSIYTTMSNSLRLSNSDCSESGETTSRSSSSSAETPSFNDTGSMQMIDLVKM